MAAKTIVSAQAIRNLGVLALALLSCVAAAAPQEAEFPATFSDTAGIDYNPFHHTDPETSLPALAITNMLHQRVLDQTLVTLQEAQLRLKKSAIDIVKDGFKGSEKEPSLFALFANMESIRTDYNTAVERNRKDMLHLGLGLDNDFMAELKAFATWEMAYLASSYNAWKEVATFYDVGTNAVGAPPAAGTQ